LAIGSQEKSHIMSDREQKKLFGDFINHEAPESKQSLETLRTRVAQYFFEY
jgi:hypothetical protein